MFSTSLLLQSFLEKASGTYPPIEKLSAFQEEWQPSELARRPSACDQKNWQNSLLSF